MAILDADKEGFLRSERSLIQTAGRAARNAMGPVILYADKVTGSMAAGHGARRTGGARSRSPTTVEHGIVPRTVYKTRRGDPAGDLGGRCRPGRGEHAGDLPVDPAEPSQEEFIELLIREMKAAADEPGVRAGRLDPRPDPGDAGGDLMEEPMMPESDLMVVDRALARLAVLEDVGDGDLTAALIPEEARAVAVVRAREPGILSGLGVATEVFNVIDPGVEVEVHCEGGAPFLEGETILRASGPTRSLLTAERSVLNFLQHLSGIATLTARFVKEVEGTGARITDTRKTTPGLRLLEKTAVLDGGGVNHRLGLYDAVMIKDNHIDAMRGVAQAIAAARSVSPGAPIIVEARDVEEARVAAEMGVGRILLDNMMPEMVEICVGVIRAIERRIAPTPDETRWIPGTWRPGDGLIQIEVSGGITLETARSYALPGVDFLAVGALTHSAAALDIAMDLEAVQE